MQQQIKVTALGYRDLCSGSEYILVRAHDSGRLVVNVMKIVTKPAFDASQGVSTFMARGLSINGRKLSEEEGAPIELSVDDIGCPFNRSPVGIACRTFAYDLATHNVLCAGVVQNQARWRSCFASKTMSFSYTYFTHTDPNLKRVRAPLAANGFGFAK